MPLREAGVRPGLERDDGGEPGIRHRRPPQLVLLVEGELLPGLRLVARRPIRARQRVVGSAEAGEQLAGPREVLDRGARLAPLRGDAAQAVVRLGRVGTLLHDLPVERPALVRAAGFQERLGQHQPRGKVAGLEPQRFVQRDDGAIVVGQVDLSPSERVGPARLGRREGVGPREAGLRQLVLLVRVEEHSQGPIPVRVPGLALRAPIGLGDRLADARFVGVERELRERRHRLAGDRGGRQEREPHKSSRRDSSRDGPGQGGESGVVRGSHRSPGIMLSEAVASCPATRRSPDRRSGRAS